MERVIAIGMCALACGCITTSGTLQTAETVPVDTWEVQGGASVPVSTRFVASVADLIGQSVEELTDGTDVSESEERDAIASGLGILLFQPTMVTSLSIRRGLRDRADVGVRMAGPAVRIDGKWQFARTSENAAFAVNGGLTYHNGIGSSVASSAFDLFDSLKLVSYSRRDVDINLLASTDSTRALSWFGAAKYMAAFTKLETIVDSVAQPRDTTNTMHLFGGTGGLRLGSQRLALLAELTIMRVLFDPDVLGQAVDLSGWIVEPALALSSNW